MTDIFREADTFDFGTIGAAPGARARVSGASVPHAMKGAFLGRRLGASRARPRILSSVRGPLTKEGDLRWSRKQCKCLGAI